MMRMHSSVTVERVIKAVEMDNNMGICIACGEDRDGCEPDATEYTCEVCGKKKVYGAEELLFMMH